MFLLSCCGNLLLISWKYNRVELTKTKFGKRELVLITKIISWRRTVSIKKQSTNVQRPPTFVPRTKAVWAADELEQKISKTKIFLSRKSRKSVFLRKWGDRSRNGFKMFPTMGQIIFCDDLILRVDDKEDLTNVTEWLLESTEYRPATPESCQVR